MENSNKVYQREFRPSNKGIIRIGLTGGIASGKSTIARIFRHLGADLIDADRIARQAIRSGTPAYRKIVRRFGRNFLRRDKEINRKKLGKYIFEHPDQRELLNAIVHPEVFRKEKEAERTIRKKKAHAVIIYDVPLLIETGSYRRMDKVILVHVTRKLQIDRLRKRNGLTREESLKRIRAQLPFHMKKKVSDFVISGTADQKKTEARIRVILTSILKERPDCRWAIRNSGISRRPSTGKARGRPAPGKR